MMYRKNKIGASIKNDHSLLMNSKYNIKTFVQKFPTHMIKIYLDIFVENLHLQYI